MPQPLDKVVESLSKVILRHPYIDGFAVGGSLARGNYKKGQYVYASVLCQSPLKRKSAQNDDITAKFAKAAGMKLRTLGWEQRGFPLSELDFRTVYIFRSENEMPIWNPPKESRYYLAIR